MFTLKLYQNGPLPPEGRTVIMEVVGVWIDDCPNDERANGMKHLRAFKKEVGVEDEGGTFECYIGGELASESPGITRGRGGNYFSWGVLENMQGKTSQVFR